MAFDFSGKKILVTGAGRGIGRVIAISLAKSGCKVYALSRTQSTLDSLVTEYPEIVPIAQDLADWDKTRTVLEKLETLDGLVNNAGSGHPAADALECPKKYIEDAMNVNALAVINCIQVVAKKMVDSGKAGSIVNVSTISSQLSCPKALGYNVSKAALDMVTKQFALELGPHNIRVNSVNPTCVTLEDKKRDPKALAPYLERTPMQRFPFGEEIAGPVMYLLSDAAAMVTGTLHFVDGGLSCNITTKQ